MPAIVKLELAQVFVGLESRGEELRAAVEEQFPHSLADLFVKKCEARVFDRSKLERLEAEAQKAHADGVLVVVVLDGRDVFCRDGTDVDQLAARLHDLDLRVVRVFGPDAKGRGEMQEYLIGKFDRNWSCRVFLDGSADFWKAAENVLHAIEKAGRRLAKK